MTACAQYGSVSTSAAQFRLLWADHVDALERHLSAKRWALAAVAVVLITYPIARVVIPAILDSVVSIAIRTLLNHI